MLNVHIVACFCLSAKMEKKLEHLRLSISNGNLMAQLLKTSKWKWKMMIELRNSLCHKTLLLAIRETSEIESMCGAE
jgi:hypothetical protein